MPNFKLIVPPLYTRRRIDAFLASALEGRFSRQEIKTALKNETVFLNGKPVKPKGLLKEGDAIEVHMAETKLVPLAAESTELKVVYEDENLLVIDKPAGMVVHPGAGNKSGTLVNALLGRGGELSDVGGTARPGIVHRLDKETSGLILVAKNNAVHRALQSQFADRTLEKNYLALVKGDIQFEEGRIAEPIARHPKIRQRMAVSHSPLAKSAETRYKVLKRFRHAALLEVKLMTGRTHQIRVHMAHLGHPVVGDGLYGTRDGWTRHALHATSIQFIHPKSGKIMKFESPLPEDFRVLLRTYERA